MPGTSSRGTPRESQVKFRDETVSRLYKGSVGTGPRGQYSGNICFIEIPGIQDEGGRHVANCSSDTRVAYPEVKIQVRDPVRVVGIVAPFDPRGSVPGKNYFYRIPGGKWHRRPQHRYATGEPGKFRGRDRVGRFLCLPVNARPAGSGF